MCLKGGAGWGDDSVASLTQVRYVTPIGWQFGDF